MGSEVDASGFRMVDYASARQAPDTGQQIAQTSEYQGRAHGSC